MLFSCPPPTLTTCACALLLPSTITGCQRWGIPTLLEMSMAAVEDAPHANWRCKGPAGTIPLCSKCMPSLQAADVLMVRNGLQDVIALSLATVRLLADPPASSPGAVASMKLRLRTTGHQQGTIQCIGFRLEAVGFPYPKRQFWEPFCSAGWVIRHPA
jgi:hypothetical protein